MTAQTTPDTAQKPIRPGERAELRRVVKAQMKALRSEVDQREADMMAEVETRLATQYQNDRNRISELSRRIKALAADANAQLAILIAEYADVVSEQNYGTFNTPYTHRRETNKDRLKTAMTASVHAQAQRASGNINRLEANLLRDLAMEALETDAALAFIQGIPTITDLMPSKPLAEIEAKFAQEGASDYA